MSLVDGPGLLGVSGLRRPHDPQDRRRPGSFSWRTLTSPDFYVRLRGGLIGLFVPEVGESARGGELRRGTELARHSCRSRDGSGDITPKPWHAATR